MSEGTKFEKGKYFAWGSALYLVQGSCEVWAGVFTGDALEVATFEIEIDPEVVIKMIEAIGGDHRYLMIGSDSGIDEGGPEEDDEE